MHRFTSAKALSSVETAHGYRWEHKPLVVDVKRGICIALVQFQGGVLLGASQASSRPSKYSAMEEVSEALRQQPIATVRFMHRASQRWTEIRSHAVFVPFGGK